MPSAGAGGAGALRAPRRPPGGVSAPIAGGLDLAAGAGAAEPWIVADARLDNRSELLAALAPDCGAGSAPSDEALILAAYERWGREVCTHLVGDFAFALWDAERRRLICGRDRMGTRPFYYHHAPGRRFLFASTCGRLLDHSEVAGGFDERMIAAHLLPCPGPPEASFFADISRLPPAHALRLDEAGLTVWRYWDVDPGRELRYDADEAYEEHFRSLFRRVMADRLGAAARPAILLSGGLDSGAAAAVAGELCREGLVEPEDGRLIAFNWTFEDLAECDERAFSDRVVLLHGLRAEPVPGDAHWLLSDYETAPPGDDPTPAVCPPLLRATLRRARELGVDALVSGAGGNAVTGGGGSVYPDLLRGGRWRSLARQLVGHRRSEPVSWPRLLRRHLVGPLLASTAGDSPRPPAPPEWIDRRLARRAGLGELAARSLPRRPFRQAARRLRYAAVANEYEERLLLKEGELHRALGVEQLLPWRDSRLFELVMALPVDQLWRAGRSKDLVRRALAGRLPEEVRNRRSVGSVAPLRTLGLRQRGAELVGSVLRRPLSEELGFVDGAALRRAYESYRAGAMPEFPLHHALGLELWLRRRLAPPRRGEPTDGARDRSAAADPGEAAR